MVDWKAAANSSMALFPFDPTEDEMVIMDGMVRAFEEVAKRDFNEHNIKTVQDFDSAVVACFERSFDYGEIPVPNEYRLDHLWITAERAFEFPSMYGKVDQ